MEYVGDYILCGIGRPIQSHNMGTGLNLTCHCQRVSGDMVMRKVKFTACGHGAVFLWGRKSNCASKLPW